MPYFVNDFSKRLITYPEDARHSAVWVEEHVPLFASKVRFSRGLAATVSGKPPANSSGDRSLLVLPLGPQRDRLCQRHPIRLVMRSNSSSSRRRSISNTNR